MSDCSITNMKKIIFLLLILFPLQNAFSDSFEKIKEKLKNAGCMHYQFISVIESDIFDTVDSTYGEAHISRNGQYYIAIGDEAYTYDLKHYFTYVALNNQLIIEKGDGNSNDDILFITKLDEFYKSYILLPDLEYRLLKKEKVIGDFPDSLIVKTDKKSQVIKEISFFDINDELNRIIFISQKYQSLCDDSLFIPNYPDSVERVKL